MTNTKYLNNAKCIYCMDHVYWLMKSTIYRTNHEMPYC